MLQVQDEKLIRTTREKDMILEKFRNRGMRITKQRWLILDIVFEQDCTSCKEIYYQASKRDKNIGIATVYRMVNALTELGVFQTNVPSSDWAICAESDQWLPCDSEKSS